MPSSVHGRRRAFFPVVLSILILIATKTSGLSLPFDNGGWSRRDVVVASMSAASSLLVPLTPALAAESASIETIDMNAINAARAKGPDLGNFMSMDLKKSKPSAAAAAAGSGTSNNGGFNIFGGGREQVSTIRPNVILAQRNPPPLLRIGPKPQIQIPRVGYSLYKTPSEQVGRAVSLALRSGVRHFDVATQYGSNKEFAKAVSTYLDGDISAMNLSEEKPELLTVLDDTRRQGEDVSSNSGIGMASGGIPTPAGKLGRKARREGLFVSHKLANTEQSTDPIQVRRAIKKEITLLGVQYLDLVSIHSPLTDTARRIETYKALLELRDSAFVKSVGVCNYGVGALDEIEKAGLEFPCMNQLELSPFNQHRDVVKWCQDRGVAIGCAAWSKLSSADGPQNGWAVVGDIAQKKGKTRAQILVRWSLQKGYVCVPRSSPSSKLERVAIAENSYGGVNPPIGGAGGGFVLTDEEMMLLDGLDVGFKAGKLGRRDGWSDGDVTGPEWDPTDFV